jgi:hypothetical protein
MGARHEKVETNELSVQNIRDRFYGTNDPVANKILRIAAEKKANSERKYVGVSVASCGLGRT